MKKKRQGDEAREVKKRQGDEVREVKKEGRRG
jgi:hypothetical protein